MSGGPLPLPVTPETGRIHDLHARVEHLTVWQLRELAHLMTGRDPGLVESTLRVLPRACRSCGQIVPLGADSNGRPL